MLNLSNQKKWRSKMKEPCHFNQEQWYLDLSSEVSQLHSSTPLAEEKARFPWGGTKHWVCEPGESKTEIRMAPLTVTLQDSTHSWFSSLSSIHWSSIGIEAIVPKGEHLSPGTQKDFHGILGNGCLFHHFRFPMLMSQQEKEGPPFYQAEEMLFYNGD